MPDLPNVKGLPELTALFTRIPNEVKKSTLRKGPSAAAAFLRDKVRAAAPLGKQSHRRGRGLVIPPGTLKRAVARIFRREGTTDAQAVYAVIVRQGKGAQAKIGKSGRQLSDHDAFYAGWVERGHKIVPRGRGLFAKSLKARRVGPTGSVPPHPFFEPTVRANATPTIELMVSTMQADVKSIIDRT